MGGSSWVYSTSTQHERFGKSVFTKHHSVTCSFTCGSHVLGSVGATRDYRHTPHGRRHLVSPFPPSEKAQALGGPSPLLFSWSRWRAEHHVLWPQLAVQRRVGPGSWGALSSLQACKSDWMGVWGCSGLSCQPMVGRARCSYEMEHPEEISQLTG